DAARRPDLPDLPRRSNHGAAEESVPAVKLFCPGTEKFRSWIATGAAATPPATAALPHDFTAARLRAALLRVLESSSRSSSRSLSAFCGVFAIVEMKGCETFGTAVAVHQSPSRPRL